jgi:hypothetical protein
MLSFASELQNMQVDSVQSWIYTFLLQKNDDLFGKLPTLLYFCGNNIM